MTWRTEGNSHLWTNYRIVTNIRGHDVWLRHKGRYEILQREIQSLYKAKSYAERHAMSQRDLPQSAQSPIP